MNHLIQNFKSVIRPRGLFFVFVVALIISPLSHAIAVNGKIAFMSTRVASIPKIFTMNADGSSVTCLMCDGGTDPAGTGSTDSRTGDQPAFSPDGKTIAFVRSPGIWLMDSEGMNQRFIGSGSNPTWSPDSAKIAFTLNVGGPNNEIFIMNADGTSPVNITNNAGNDVLPSWGAVVPNHPQGRIAFRSSRSGNSEIYVIAPTSLAATFQSSPQINVTNNAAFDSAPRWSPDGTKIVFVSNRDSPNNELYTLDLDSFVVTRVTTDTFVDDSPTWSPDGTKIAYTSFRNSSNEIIVIDAVSGALSPGNVTNNAANDSSPCWGAGATDCAIEFTDVASSDPFYVHVKCVACRAGLSGFVASPPCTTGAPCFQPASNLTRGLFAKAVSLAVAYNDTPTTQTFADVDPASTFYPYVERLFSRGLVSGFACGGPNEPCGAGNAPYFRPFVNITRGQAAKIISLTAGFTETPSIQTYSDVTPPDPFYTHIERLTLHAAAGGFACGGSLEPCDSQNRPYFRPSNSLTRAQASQMISVALLPDCYTVTVNKAGNGAGVVTNTDNSINCGPTCTHFYPNGTTLGATASAGSVFTGWLQDFGGCTGIGGCTPRNIKNVSILATFAPDPFTPRYDIDGNGGVDALTDGLLIIRYLFGLSGTALTDGVIGAGSTRTPAQSAQFLVNIKPMLDIDGDGRVDALTDGVMAVRYLFGLRGPSLIVGAVSTNTGPIRTTATQIEQYIQTRLP